jgi:hypothetical protein
MKNRAYQDLPHLLIAGTPAQWVFRTSMQLVQEHHTYFH